MPSRSAESEGRGNPATPFWEVKLNTSYEMVNTVSGIRSYLEGADRVAFDIETAPDDEWRFDDRASLDPHRAHIVGCSFSVKPLSTQINSKSSKATRKSLIMTPSIIFDSPMKPATKRFSGSL